MVESKERPAPFAIQFQEKIPKEDVAQIEGKYNEKTQKWDWPKDPQNHTTIISSAGTERPPTICNRPTWITPDKFSVDHFAVVISLSFTLKGWTSKEKAYELIRKATKVLPSYPKNLLKML